MDDQLRELITKKNIASLLILAILVLAIPLGVQLVRQQQVLKSRAATASATFVPPNVEQRTGPGGPVNVATQSSVGVLLTPPDGWLLTAPPPSSTPTSTPSSTPTPTTIDLTGVYSLVATTTSCPAGCTSGTHIGDTWPHTMNITTMNMTTGAFSGTGNYNRSPYTTWKVTGTETTSHNVTFHIVYDPGTAGSYFADFSGTVASNRSMSGTATDVAGATFTFTATPCTGSCPTPTSTPTLTPTPAPTATPRPATYALKVYYNSTTLEHWTTTDAQAHSGSDYTFEKTQGYIRQQNDGSGKLVAFYDCTRVVSQISGVPNATDHFNSTNTTECTNKTLLGYIFSSPPSGLANTVLYRCSQPADNPDRSTQLNNCSGVPVNEGILGYVLNSP